MSDRWHKLLSNIRINNGAEALGAALFSLAATGLCMFASAKYLFVQLPVYQDLWAGRTVWDGYNKQGDLILFYLMYFLLPVFFVLFLVLKHALEKYKTHFFSVSKGRKKEKMGGIGRYLIGMILALEGIRAVKNAALGFFPDKGDSIIRLQMILSILFVIAAVGYLSTILLKKRDLEAGTSSLIAVAGLLLPIQLLGYNKFYYAYEGETEFIKLFSSAEYQWLCLGLFCILFLYQGYRLLKRKTGISLVTLMLLGAGTVVHTPDGTLNVDFFHSGEVALPMQQLVSYGKLPYFNADPIHGLCDLFTSAINYTLFDGLYFSQNAAEVVGEIMIAALLCAVIGLCMSNRHKAVLVIYLFMPFLVREAGIRYLFLFAAFFILFSDGVRKDGRWFLWWWVLLCMTGIAWNVSIGSSMAMAFLPEVLYRIFTEIFPKLKGIKKWTGKEKRKFGIAYGILMAAGLSYIPLFLQILRYLSENAGTTLYVNGTSVFGAKFVPVPTFALMIPYLLALTYALWRLPKGKSVFVSLFSCLMVISNYACVRYDVGSRLAVLAVFFSLFFFCMICSSKETYRPLYVVSIFLCLGISLWLAKEELPGRRDYSMQAQRIPLIDTAMAAVLGEEPDAIRHANVYVSGEELGMPNLGKGYINQYTLSDLQNVKTVIDWEADGNGYVDLTNMISQYVILDKENLLPYTSVYNISNRKMQERAIAVIEEKRPRLILVYPHIQFDITPMPLRSMELYLALIKMGYEPYRYGRAIYLLNDEPNLTDAVSGISALATVDRKDNLGALPLLWGNVKEVPEMGNEAMRIQEYDMRESQDGKRIVISFYEPLDGKEISYIRIIPKDQAVMEPNLTLYYDSDVDGQTYLFTFLSKINGKGGENGYFVPVGSSAFWQYSKIEQIEIEGAAFGEIDRIELY